MRCEVYLPLVEKLADGEATAVEKRDAEAHLETCVNCREHLQFLQVLPRAARQTSPEEKPPEMYWEALPQKIMARVARLEKGEKPARPGWFLGLVSLSGLRWAGAIAVALIAAVIGLQVLDAPFSRQTAEESASALHQDVAAGKEGQGSVGSLSESEDKPTDVASSEPSSSQRSDVSPAPSAPPPSEAPRMNDESRESFARHEPLAESGAEALEKTVAVGETSGMDRDETESFQSRGPVEADVRRREMADGSSGEPSESPLGARSLRSRPGREAAAPQASADAPAGQSVDADYHALLDRYPLEETVAAGANAESALGGQAGRAEKQRECAEWRGFVERHDHGEQVLAARYRLALCSIDLYRLEPSDDNRRQALEDGRSFLAIEPSGERAEAVRDALERIGE